MTEADDALSYHDAVRQLVTGAEGADDDAGAVIRRHLSDLIRNMVTRYGPELSGPEVDALVGQAVEHAGFMYARQMAAKYETCFVAAFRKLLQAGKSP
ncbi:MAG: hypothetical protein M3394_01055 [Actinomycetota bacterium]|nr:hypothetical protein [Actinomycetota bacterium]MDQ3787857.1 hypothetical protein [Actinomycetota bacterium]